MEKQQVIMVGKKQSFLARVMIKKIQDQDIACEFVPWNVDAINAHWEHTALVILFMDERERPPEDILRFLVDKVDDTGNMMILVGEKQDLALLSEQIPKELVYQSFSRPVNNDQLANTVSDFIRKVESGEFRKSILVVDDDPGFLGLAREWLKDTYKVAMASSGLQAIKWLGKNKVDLILLDHEMPVTSGPQVLEMLRSENDTKSIPVMFLTGKSDKESVMAVMDLKPEGYFLKTIQREELLRNLARFFAQKKEKKS